MATLTPTELTKLRNKAERLANKADEPIIYIKSQINSAFQALEDWFEVDPETDHGKTKARVQIATAIENAQPTLFTNQAKKILGASYLELKAKNEIASF